MFNIFAILAEFEHDLIRERIQVGLTAARERGRIGGHPRGHSKDTEATTTAGETL